MLRIATPLLGCWVSHHWGAVIAIPHHSPLALSLSFKYPEPA